MNKLLDLSYWRAVVRNPVAMTSLAVDLAPLIGIAFWHWGAVALVMLYWLENVVIGLFVLPRMAVNAIGKRGPLGLFGMAFDGPFFTLHYGMFCWCHGMILMALFKQDPSWAQGSDLLAMMSRTFNGALASGLHLDWILALVVAAHMLGFAWDYLLQGGWRDTTPSEEMFRPYLRVIGLHIGVFVVGWALQALGDPAFGALLLVLARAWWGLQANMKRPAAAGSTKVFRASQSLA